MTNESAATPSDTMNPAMPARRQREAHLPAEEHEHAEGQRRRQHQAAEDDRTEQPVVEEGVRDDQEHADAGSEQARPQVVGAEGGRDGAQVTRVERDRQRAVLELVGQQRGRGLGEAAGDLRLSCSARAWIPGAETISLSRTTATWQTAGALAVLFGTVATQAPPSLLYASRVSSVHFLAPSLLKVRSTFQAEPAVVSMFAAARRQVGPLDLGLVQHHLGAAAGLTGHDLLVFVLDRASRPLVEHLAGHLRHVELDLRRQQGDLLGGQRAERLELGERGGVRRDRGRILDLGAPPTRRHQAS